MSEATPPSEPSADLPRDDFASAEGPDGPTEASAGGGTRQTPSGTPAAAGATGGHGPARPSGGPKGAGPSGEADRGRLTARHATWGPWVAVGGTVLALVLGLILALPVLAGQNGQTDSLGGTARVFVQLMTAAGFLIAPFLIASQSGPGGLAAAARRLGLVAFRPGAAAKWIGIALVGYLAFALVWASVFGEPKQDDIAGKLGPIWTQILLIAVLAPISEEICFRGLLFGGFRSRFSFPVAAIGAGLVFGLLHYSTGWSTVPQLAVLGAAFALVYERTGSLWPPIIFHALNNAFVLATLN